MTELVILGETPAKKNSKIFNTKTHRMFPSKNYQEWHEQAVIQVRSQFKEKTYENPVWITVSFYHADKRRRDSDNGLSSILDLLVDCKVIKDDCWQLVPVIHVYNITDENKRARCEIQII